jgi:hypothetical protein
VPKSTKDGDSVNPSQAVAMAARTKGGVYVAYCVGYPTCSHLQLWEVGTSNTVEVPNSKGADAVALAAAPRGRMWVAWIDDDDRVRATRSNGGVTRFGPVRNAGHPSGEDVLYRIAAEGSTGRLDVVVNSGDAFWHTQILPGLSMTARPREFDGSDATTVKFKVTDAGEGRSRRHRSGDRQERQDQQEGDRIDPIPGWDRPGTLQGHREEGGIRTRDGADPRDLGSPTLRGLSAPGEP